jgi:hypothetical protein
MSDATPEARNAAEAAFMAVLGELRGGRWRPLEGPQGHPTPAAGPVVGELASPEDQRALSDGDVDLADAA